MPRTEPALPKRARRANAKPGKKLESRATIQDRKQEFIGRMAKNLANDDPLHEDRLVDEFRDLILGR